MKLRQQTLVYFVTALMVAACVSSVEAQGRRGGAPGGQGGRGGFGQGGPRGGMMGGGFGMRGNSELMLLARPDVRKELDLVDDQIKELEGLAGGGGTDFRALMEGTQDLSQEERRAKFTEIMEKAQKETQAKINDILLPHQATRLSQLAVQFAMQGRDGVTSGTVAEQLGISEEQRDQLREKARVLQEEMQKKMQDELIKELTPTQQAKLKKLIGNPFTFEQTAPQFGRPGAPGAAPGGRRRGN